MKRKVTIIATGETHIVEGGFVDICRVVDEVTALGSGAWGSDLFSIIETEDGETLCHVDNGPVATIQYADYADAAKGH